MMLRLYADEARVRVLSTLNFLRQQKGKPDGQPHECLADYVAPQVERRARLLRCVRGDGRDLGSRSIVARFERSHDDYSAIMLKALADRLAEAAAEHFHERVRRELWGYAAAETLTNEQLVREEYRGIRPAPGYPACPDHTEKAQALGAARCRAQRRHPSHGILCHVPDRGGERLVHRASTGALFRGRQDRSRTG